MDNKKMKNCKACNKEISKSAKKCPDCGHDQRSFFAKHKILTVIIALVVLAGVGSALSGGGTKDVEHVAYQYGDVISKENTVEGSKFKIPEDLSISIDRQDIISKEELKAANPINDGTNDVAMITLTLKNDSKEAISYNTMGFSFVTEEGNQLKDAFGTMVLIPDEYKTTESLGSGDIMPNSNFTRHIIVEIPDNDKIKTLSWDYFDIKFTIELN